MLSVFHFALAAPVAVLEVRSNAVDAPKDEIAAWEKRMDSNPGVDSKTDADDMDTDHPFDSESDARSPERFYNDLPYDKPNSNLDSDSNYNSDSYSSNSHNTDTDTDADTGNDSDDPDYNENDDNDNSGYDTERDDGNGNLEGGYEGDDERMAENTSLGPESGHPATPELMTDVEKLLDPLRFRPRNSGSGAVSTPKREL